RFFLWTAAEIDTALPDAAERVKQYFGVTREGNFAGRNILSVPEPPAAVAQAFGIPADHLSVSIADAKRALLAVRAQREAPLRDDKIIAGWNGLAISALARGGFAFAERRYVAAAERTAQFIERHMLDHGRLRRSFAGGEARNPAALEDYAFLINGLLDLHEATQDRRWARQAIALEQVLEAHYADPRGGLFATAADA